MFVRLVIIRNISKTLCDNQSIANRVRPSGLWDIVRTRMNNARARTNASITIGTRKTRQHTADHQDRTQNSHAFPLSQYTVDTVDVCMYSLCPCMCITFVHALRTHIRYWRWIPISWRAKTDCCCRQQQQHQHLDETRRIRRQQHGARACRVAYSRIGVSKQKSTACYMRRKPQPQSA